MDRDSFVEFVIRQGLSREELRRRFPEIAANTVLTSLAYYGVEFKEELRELKHRRYSLALKGNTHGKKAQPGVLLDRSILQEDLRQGLGLAELALKHQTTEWFVSANIRHHGLAQTDKLPYKMRLTDLAVLAKLESFAPGITSSAEAYYEDPHAFFLKLYEALRGVVELTWFIKEQATPHAHFVDAGKVPRDHISWRMNRHEIMLSWGLLAVGLAHTREVKLGGYWFDFFIEEGSLLVEVDGSFHDRDASTKSRDRKKDALAKAHEVTLLRFTTKQVEEDLPWVLEQIQAYASGRLPASVP